MSSYISVLNHGIIFHFSVVISSFGKVIIMDFSFLVILFFNTFNCVSHCTELKYTVNSINCYFSFHNICHSYSVQTTTCH